MKKSKPWTLLGSILDIYSNTDLSTSDKITISRVVEDVEKNFVRSGKDKRAGPDFQEADIAVQKLKALGFEEPEEYRKNKEKLLMNLVSDLENEGSLDEAAVAKGAILNRRFGSFSHEKEGD